VKERYVWMELFSKNSNMIVRAVLVSSFAKSGTYSQVSECPSEVASLVMDGKMKVKIDQVFDLEDIVPCRNALLKL